MSVLIRIEMSLVLEKSRFTSLRCGHLFLILALPILFGSKFKVSTTQAFLTFVLPGWEPHDMKKLTNFDFIFVVDETAFENWISLSCLLKFK